MPPSPLRPVDDDLRRTRTREADALAEPLEPGRGQSLEELLHHGAL